ncbi:MAG: hypothetical protein RL207_201 [Bacteroidota bacterium]|jgi:hypothetical protein
MKKLHKRSMQNLFFKITVGLSFIWTLFACSPKVGNELMNGDKLPKIKDKELVDRLDSLSKIEPKTFYSKLDINYKDSTTDISFKTSLKIVADSAVSAIITYARIPIVTAMVTKDTITVVNKREKCYTVQSLDYLKTTFGVDFTYENMEELFLGKPLDYNIEQKYFVDHDPYRYSISTHKKRDKKRMDRRPKEDIVLNYILSNDGKSLQQTTIKSPSDSTEITVIYEQRQEVNGMNVPKVVHMHIKAKEKGIYIKMDYEKVEINEPQELIIVIPEKYEKCK